MPRGGWRGGGRPSPFKNQPTKTIRVPVVLADEVLEFAKLLDSADLSRAGSDFSEIQAAREILTQALELKANAGGAIKHQIREALLLLPDS